MEEEFKDEIKCPICFDIPQKEIFQCQNGHTICSDCSMEILECPQCRIRFDSSKIRNRVLENLLDMMKFDCVHKSLGCNVKISRAEIASHTETCAYGQHNISLCEHLGCNFLINTKNGKEAVAHFVEVHGIPTFNCQVVNIFLEGFKEWSRPLGSRRRFCTPAILNLMPGTHVSTHVLCVILFNNADQTMSINFIQLDESLEKSNENLRIEFSIKPVDPIKVPDIVWSIPITKVKDALETINYPILQLKYDRLLERYLKNGKLHIRCSTSINILNTTDINEVNNSVTVNCPTRQINSSPSAQLPFPPGIISPPIPSTDFQMPVVNSGSSTLGRTAKPHKPFVFMKVNCNICGQMPISVEYKCLQCASYDLCQSCYLKGEHQHHIFALVSNKKQLSLLRKNSKDSKSWKPLFQNPLTAGGNAKMPGSSMPTTELLCSFCTNTDNSIPKYICLQCRPNYKICKACFVSVSCSHFKDHSFAVADTETKLKIILKSFAQNGEHHKK